MIDLERIDTKAATPATICRTLQAGDAAQVARLHVRSFPGFFLTCLGPRTLRRFYAWFAGKPAGLAFVALQEQRVVGFVVGWHPPYGWYDSLVRDLWATLALGVARGLLVMPIATSRHVWQRRLRIWQAIRAWGRPTAVPPARTPDPRHASLDSIAVEPEQSGAGVAAALLSAFVAEAQRREIALLRLSVLRSNARARAFYEKHGWYLGREVAAVAKYEYGVPRSSDHGARLSENEAKVLLVVRRTQTARARLLEETFAGKPVRVIWDRRIRERRAQQQPVPTDRRRTERRASPEPTWTTLDVVVVEPTRTSDAH